jgi:hypothetical protein
MKLFGYSISLNVLILIGILYLIMVVNALSGTCNREGMTTSETAGETAGIDIINSIVEIMNQTITSSPNPLPIGNFMAYSERVNNAMIRANSTLVTEKGNIALEQIKKAMETADYQRAAQQAVQQAELDRQKAAAQQAELDRQMAAAQQAELDRQMAAAQQAASARPDPRIASAYATQPIASAYATQPVASYQRLGKKKRGGQ